MNVQIVHLRRLMLAAVTAVAIMSIAGAALAAGSSLSLEVKGQYAKRHEKACGKSARFRLLHRRSTIEFRGFLVPPTGRHFNVRVELKRCVRGAWKDAGSLVTVGKKTTGKYKAFTAARTLAPRSHRRKAIAFYKARSVTAGAISPEAYFAVTN